MTTAHGKDVLDALHPEVRQLRKAIPDVWAAYADLHRQTLTDGALSGKAKELIALGIAVTRECDGCIAAHARGAARAGASSQEVAEALGVALLMNGGPATVYGPRAFAAFTESSRTETAEPSPSR
ncbi:4-carboxymuconolactone decarboxylase [Frankia sp. Hr75.2]|nr:4-carboxymuconolactone decarboxylase [Frankia sp. Hr75.2]